MKTNERRLSYLDQFFVEREMLRKNVVEKFRTHILCSINFFFANHAICDTMLENIVKPGTPRITKWRMCIAC